MDDGTKRVLLVDDERAFVRGISAYLRTQGGFDVVTAVNGLQALEILGEQAIDVVVTDLEMPLMNGFELLAQMRDSYPKLPVIVMTAYSTPETLERMASIGAIPCLEKPLVLEDFVSELQAVLEQQAHGFLRGISVASILQLLEMERKTVTLNVAHGTSKGSLSFREGCLIDAETGNLRGDSAALEIISWEAATVELAAGGPSPHKTIVSGLHFLMLEAMRLVDEGRSVEDIDLGHLSPAPVEPIASTHTLSPAQKTTIGKAVNEVGQIDGVSGVALLSKDDQILSSHAVSDLESFESSARAFAEIAATSQAVATKSRFGGCSEISFGTEERLVLIQSPEIAGEQPVRVVVVVEWSCDHVALARRLGDTVPLVLESLAAGE